jgi:aminoglycoside phosphotransferase (APT) family kinase protein
MDLGLKLEELVNVGNLTAWLDKNIPQLGDGPLQCALVHGGLSNVIISLNRGGETLMLRRPPAVPPPGAEKTMLREAQVLSALDKTNVPHPRCYGSCDDVEVIGACFYVMEQVDGWSGKVVGDKVQHLPPFDKMPYEYGIPFAVVDALVALGNVDHKAVGLENYGKPGNFLERQVDRWANQLASYKERYGYEGRELPGYKETEAWLRANTPKVYKEGIIHGDIGTTNMLFAYDPPARLNALIDWELSTIGDPMIDLAWFTSGMRDEHFPNRKPHAVQGSNDWPTRQELARYYAAGTGRDISNFDYYTLLARFKSGCILEYKVAQAAIGKIPHKTGEFFAKIVLDAFADAAELIRKIG